MPSVLSGREQPVPAQAYRKGRGLNGMGVQLLVGITDGVQAFQMREDG